MYPNGYTEGTYGDVAGDLSKIAEAFQDSFFGEMTGFYAGYAQGLAGNFDKVLVLTASVKTRLTLWGDAVSDMHSEVAVHVMPRPRIVNPNQPLPPTTAPVVEPPKRP